MSEQIKRPSWLRKKGETVQTDSLETDFGSAKDLYEKGWQYYDGGIYDLAVECYLKSAEQGNADAQCNLGKCYYNGEGVKQDYEKAAEWYLKSAEQGDAEAQYNLGICYENGKGVKQDYEKAVEWCLKSAEQGHAEAQFKLGECYYDGEGVKQDYKKAVEWYLKSAEQGHAEAQYNLGICYEYGEGVKQNYKKAEEWYRKAAAQGHEEAIKKVNSDCCEDDRDVDEAKLENICNRVTDIIVVELGVNYDEVIWDASFEDDLECDPLDVIELIGEIEKEFGITIADEDAVQIETVGDLVMLIYNEM